MRNHRSQMLVMLMLAGFVLWLTAPANSGASTQGWEAPASDEVRLYAGLSGPALGGVTPSGVAEHRDRESRRRLEVSASGINLASGTSLSVRINGAAVGTMTVDGFSNASLSLDTNNGQSVPAVSSGATLQVLQNTTVILSGNFSSTPPPSPSPSGSPSASPSPSGSPSATPSPGASPSPSPSPSGSPGATPSPNPSPSASPSPSPSGSPSATPSPGASPSPNPSPSPSGSPSPSPSPGSSNEIEATLSGPALNGITPTGRAKYEIDSFSAPISGDGPELEVRADNVNLIAGTVLRVEVNGALVGTATLRSSGRAELRISGSSVPPISAGTTVAVKQGATVIVSGAFSATPSPSPSPSGSPGATPSPNPSPSPSGSPGATPSPNPSPSPSGSPGATPSPTPALGNCTLSFGAAQYSGSENAGSITVTVNRNCTTAGASRVEVESENGSANDRTDFIKSSTRLWFAAGETSKTVSVIVVNDNYVEGAEAFTVKLEDSLGATLASPSTASLNIADDDSAPATNNPFEAAQFFVRQHYSDFLSREPDQAGLDYWTSQVANCGTDTACITTKRNAVSAAFFIELEFQDTGSYIYRLYQASLGRRPVYDEFAPDRARIIGGANVEQSKADFANDWVTRPAFRAEYPDNWIPEQFVHHLFDKAALTGFDAERQAEIAAMYAGRTRAQVLRNIIEINAFKQREYNPSFVLMQYFGYLRREPDQGGYEFWLSVLNQQPANARGMVCAFITSREMQERFSNLAPRTNGECQ